MRTVPLARTLAALLLLLCSLTARADPNQYVTTPIVEEGERELDFKTGQARLRDGRSSSATSLGLGWGTNSWWFTELYAKWRRPVGEPSAFDAWEWENRLQLTPTGKFAVDVGALIEIERPKDRSEGYELTSGLLLQSEWGRWQGNLNLLGQRHARAAAPSGSELNYQWQVKFRASQSFEWGAQGFGNLGPGSGWASAAQQQHQAGPAIFGKLKTGTGEAIAYNAAALFGSNGTTARAAVRLQAEYEF